MVMVMLLTPTRRRSSIRSGRQSPFVETQRISSGNYLRISDMTSKVESFARGSPGPHLPHADEVGAAPAVPRIKVEGIAIPAGKTQTDALPERNIRDNEERLSGKARPYSREKQLMTERIDQPGNRPPGKSGKITPTGYFWSSRNPLSRRKRRTSKTAGSISDSNSCAPGEPAQSCPSLPPRLVQ